MQQKLINRHLLIAIVFALTSKITVSQTVSKTVENCGCDYFPMCNYTAKKQFGEDTYYGIKGSEIKGTYYNCKNGIVTVKWFTEEEYLAGRQWQWRSDINDYGYVDYYDTETVTNTKVLYKFNLPVGSEWKTSTGEGDFETVYRIESKNLSISVNGIKYINILKLSAVTKTKKTQEVYINQQDAYSTSTGKYIYVNTFYDNGEVFKNSLVYYFDKNLGLIKEENTWDDFRLKHPSRLDGIKSPEEGKQWQLYNNLTPEQKKEIENIQNAKIQNQKDEENRIAQAKINEKRKNDSLATAFELFKGKPDKSLAGTWRYYNKNARDFLFYSFDADGNFKYYVGKIDTSDKYLKKNGKYLVHDDSVVVFYQAVNNNYLEGFRISKINNAHTGKPSFNIIYDKGKLNEFENITTNQPWPGMPPFGNGNKPQPRETKLDGIIDNDLVGVWKHTSTSKSGKSLMRTYIFNKDGTGSYLHLLDGKEWDSNKKFDWRYAQNQFLWFTEDCDVDLKCPTYIYLSKETIKGKKVLKIDFKEYYRE